MWSVLLCVQSQFSEPNRSEQPIPVDQSWPRCGLLSQSVWLASAFMRPRLDSCGCFYAVSV
nr:MAG TPA: hypothetical protein [Caudoviricetes sp.]